MKKLFAILVIVAVAYGAWRGRDKVADRGGQDLFFGRAWVDHIPQSRREIFHVFGIFRNEPFGWFAERSGWKGDWEMFRYEPRGEGRVDVVLPQSGQTLRLSYRAWRCTEDKDFDYCLEVSGGKGPTKYYSRRGWERRNVDEARALETQLAAAQP